MRRILVGWVVLVALGTSVSSVRAQGILLPGGGPAGRAMGGASTAVALDATSALFWNPATMGALPRSQVVIGGELAIPDINLSSNLPLLGQGGTTRSDSGVSLLTGIGAVYRDQESPLTFGLLLASVGGGSVNFPGGTDNPIVSPNITTPNGQTTVLGPIAGLGAFNQLAPTVAYQATDRLIVGLGPTIGISLISLDPAFFGGADDASGDGLRTFPTGSHSRPFWGAGFRVGMFYHLTDTVDVGFSYNSPQWNETWEFYSRNEVGVAQTLELQATLPAIYSWGMSYRGVENLILAADLRYIDYENSDLFGERLLDGGLGWESVFALGLGAQYEMSERLAVRLGYQYNDNPIRDVLTLFNTQLPGISEHSVSAGVQFQLNEWISSTLGYVHTFENSITGPVSQVGEGTTTISTEADYILFGLQINFGPTGKRECVACAPCIEEPVAYPAAMPSEVAPHPIEVPTGIQ